MIYLDSTIPEWRPTQPKYKISPIAFDGDLLTDNPRPNHSKKQTRSPLTCLFPQLSHSKSHWFSAEMPQMTKGGSFAGKERPMMKGVKTGDFGPIPQFVRRNARLN